MASTLSTHGRQVVTNAIYKHYADALNAGIVPSLDAKDRAIVKRLLECGVICFSTAGRWVVRGEK